MRSDNDFVDEAVTDETREQAEDSTGLTKHVSAPTLNAIGNSLDLRAATTSDNPDAARKRWRMRRVMQTDSEGRQTSNALILRNVTFNGSRQFVNRVPDIGISTTVTLKDLGKIEIQPLFVHGIDYIQWSDDSGSFVPSRSFAGVIYRPGKEGGAYKFVPVDFADPMLIEKWNGIVEEGKRLGTDHGKWPTITIQEEVGQSGQNFLTFAPPYVVERTFTRKVKGKSRDMVQERIGTYFLKAVIMAPRSQQVPIEAIKLNAKLVGDGQRPTEEFVFLVSETENSLVVTLRGRAGEELFEDSIETIEEKGENYNPFEVLDTTVESFSVKRADRFVEGCLKMPINDDNRLYVRAVELNLVIKGQTNTAVRGQLRSLASDAFARAQSLWKSELEGMWSKLDRQDPPSIEECLQGHLLFQLLQRLNLEDAAAALVAKHVPSGNFDPTSLLHRELRSRLLKKVAHLAGYKDPQKPDVKVEPTPDPEPAPPTLTPAQKAAATRARNKAEAAKQAAEASTDNG